MAVALSYSMKTDAGVFSHEPFLAAQPNQGAGRSANSIVGDRGRKPVFLDEQPDVKCGLHSASGAIQEDDGVLLIPRKT